MYGPMKKRNIPVILLLPLLSLSCSLSHKMERSISKVGLSQAGKRPAPDTTCYSVPEKITWKDSSGVEHIQWHTLVPQTQDRATTFYPLGEVYAGDCGEVRH